MTDARDDAPTDAPAFTPPAIWTWTQGSGGKFANINRPMAGATHEQALHSRCETLNRAVGMVEGTIGLWGQPIRRGPLWDK